MKMRVCYIVVAVMIAVCGFAQDPDLPDGIIQEDDPVMYQLDQLLLQGWAAKDPAYKVQPEDPATIPYPSEEEIEMRLMELDKGTPVELTYNKVG